MKTLFPDAVLTGEVLERLRLPDIARYELVDGRIEVLTPTNKYHAEATGRIAALLKERMPGWRILAGDPGVYVRRQPDTVRGPDVVAISEERYRQSDRERAFLTVVPELVVEIISPSNEEEDIGREIAEYLAAGAAFVWVVNVDERKIAAYDRAGAFSSLSEADDELILPNGESIAASEMV
jgi:Uma2 family endonuclease